MRIYLIGMPGVGKSTIGKRLAKRLKWFFIDLDAYIEMRSGKRIPEIFKLGEGRFRELETSALMALPKGRRLVVATGGGVVLSAKNVAFMKKTGIVIYLMRPLEEIASSFNIEKRPLMKQEPQKVLETLSGLYQKRHALYEEAATITVDSSDIKRVVQALIQEVKQYDHSHH